MDWSFFAQLLLNGIVIGVIYALVAMGLSLIFGVLEIVNFAHGEFYMLAAMLAYFLTVQLGLRLLGDHRRGDGRSALCRRLRAVRGPAWLAARRGFERSILLTWASRWCCRTARCSCSPRRRA